MMKKWFKAVVLALAIALVAAGLAGCMHSQEPLEDAEQSPTQSPEAGSISAQAPEMPDKIQTDEDGVPQLVVYNVDQNAYSQMDIESYVEGVLAGEMRNDWPMEALKAQAILARTFVMRFVDEKDSRYDGADISTDIEEAQAYDEAAINERIKRAVDETRGEVMVYDGQFPYAWFHAHAGGQTELATAALEYERDEPGYTRSVESPDSDRAPDAVKNWKATFTAAQVGEAAAKTGVKTGEVESIEIGEKGESGRAITLKINGMSVSAPALRLQLGSKELKSTLIDSVSVENGEVTFTGRGYGHGVGMSQWGAYGMAEAGEDAESIVQHYFNDVDIVKMWA